MLRVTTIIPTCQRPALLERALRSVAAQEVAPADIVVVHDGPAADLPAVRLATLRSGCDDAAVIANSHMKGPGGARNAGAEHAAGEWLAFLDDDDEWLPGYLRAVQAHIDACGLDVLCTDLVYCYGDGSEKPGKRACDRLTAEQFLTSNPGLIGSNLVIRRTLYAAVGGFDETILCAEDNDFGIRLSLHGSARYAPLRERLVRHYQHDGPRICVPQSAAVRSGIRRFFELHAHRMTTAQRQEFGRNVRRLWGIDERGQLV